MDNYKVLVLQEKEKEKEKTNVGKAIRKGSLNF